MWLLTAMFNTFLSFHIYLFGVLCRFQHCTGHITKGSQKGRGNQYIEFLKDLYYKLPPNGKQLPAFPLEAVPGTEPRPQRLELGVSCMDTYTHHIDLTVLTIPHKTVVDTGAAQDPLAVASSQMLLHFNLPF